jgi:UPF0716 protein FxsA
MWAVRAQGQNAIQRAMQQFRAEMDAGQTPQMPFLDGLLLFVGGILLILPGLIGDAVGLLLLIPPVRCLAAPRLSAWLMARQAAGVAGGARGGTRFFYFQSGGFPPPGPGRIIFDETPPQDEADETPRQATIIDSTAIEIESDRPDDPSKKTS